ncbi:MAG: peptidoglycan DD-metalloendopeptidase family protein [Gammaproteobacteria bacterium]|nr:peptidoglycan DD-metalloendopeptidase family protein [Gammaproteobacteria bacterium]
MPVTEESTPQRYPESEYRTVAAGDTLYSIAWEAGRDYRELAKWNSIRPPYIVRPAQRIRLYPPSYGKKSVGSSYRVVVAGDTLYSIAADVGIHYRQLAEWNNIRHPYVIRPGQRLRVIRPGKLATATQQRSTKSPSRAKTLSKAPPKATATGPWVWPTDGPILARFTPNGANKGLDIGGNRGQTVRAAAAGQVVYQGSGLRGYGQLIIVKHNGEFLSAYAHCDRIYVEEGDVIKVGQKIAAMGGSGADRVKLHFEIRYRGSPVDPLKYLPRK